MTGWMWSLVTILGPALLIAAIIWATLRNRRAGARKLERSERSAREVREEIARDPEYD